MRFVPSPPPPVAPVESEEPQPLKAVRPVRRVEPRTRVPQVIQRFRRKEKPVEAAGGAASFREKRLGEDRRKWCRRLQRDNPLLNTRCGEERRKKIRRSGDVATTLDEEA